MKLYLVIDTDRWGHSINLVAANDRDEAKRLACPHSSRFDIEEIPVPDEPSVLWCRDESPDSPLE